jgi:hypothetical protein
MILGAAPRVVTAVVRRSFASNLEVVTASTMLWAASGCDSVHRLDQITRMENLVDGGGNRLSFSGDV